MPLVKAQCTNCGAPLEVDNSKDAAICPSCGTPYIVEKAIQQFQLTGVNTIHADNIILNNDPTEKEFAAADSQLKFKIWASALERYQQLAESNPQDARSWYGLLRSITHDGTVKLLTKQDFDASEASWQRAQILGCNEKTEFWNSYLAAAKETLHSYQLALKDKYIQAKNELDELDKHKPWLWKGISGGGVAVSILFITLLPAFLGELATMIGCIMLPVGIYGLTTKGNSRQQLRKRNEKNKDLKMIAEECSVYGVRILS